MAECSSPRPGTSTIRLQGAYDPLRTTASSSALDIFLYGYIIPAMARSATTSDAFNAVAEPRRRQILDLLALGERSVTDIAAKLRVRQPQASKHLRVLKQVGLVTVRGAGRRRMYRLDAGRLKPIHDWVKSFERFWNERLDRLGEYLNELQSREQTHE
jgi:DNA-binding transcriptional ArsR family regulator